MNILVCDEISDGGLDILRAIPGANVEVKTKQSETDLVHLIPNFEAAVVRSATKITSRIIEAAPHLRVIARAGMGYDNVDVSAATAKGVVVMNTPAKNSTAAAEHAVALMFALARNIPQASVSLREGKWERKSFMGTELSGKRLGVLGLGNVGREVARRGIGLGMRVLGYDPFIAEPVAREVGADMVELEELFDKSDLISLHMNLNDQTRHLINSKTLGQMKHGVRIINCARGGVIDEAALLEALNQGKVAGAGLDVLSEEPPPPDHPLLHHPKVIVTPHLGASTLEAQELVGVAIAEQLRTFFIEEVVVNGVNVPAVSREIMLALGGQIELARRLGSLLGQIGLTSVEEVVVEANGEISKYDPQPISASALLGLMGHLMEESVNYVNAPLLAKERGIRLIESKSEESKTYSSVIRMELRSGETKNSATGTLFGKDQPRIVEVNGFTCDVRPQGWILLIRNQDQPGVVGNWATLLGKRAINISQMQLSLKKEEEQALAIVNVDSQVPEDILEELRAIENIESVRQVQL